MVCHREVIAELLRDRAIISQVLQIRRRISSKEYIYNIIECVVLVVKCKTRIHWVNGGTDHCSSLAKQAC